MSTDGLDHFPSEDMSHASIGQYGVACALAGLLLDTFFLYAPVISAYDSGIFSTQLASYLNSKAKDPVWLKTLVGAVAAVASFSTGYNWWLTSKFFVYNYGTYSTAFFAYRAYRLCGRNIWIPISVGLCNIASIGSTIAIRAVYPIPSGLETHTILPPGIAWQASTLTANTLITAAIAYGLITLGKRTPSSDLVTHLSRLCLESQAAATAIALALLLNTIIDRSLFTVLLLFHSKIYVIGLFYCLNSRSQVMELGSITMHAAHPLVLSTQAATVVNQHTEMHVLRVQPARDLNRPSQGEEEDAKTQSIQSLISACSPVPDGTASSSSGTASFASVSDGRANVSTAQAPSVRMYSTS
ncbi:hypothetical protein CspeluHIS016_0403060 [Cutaneotrichosporon spelunceum]|uniref:DUF6534 domain-containing protein n=1 Tax=Cutaneotrichosporon spelunceum TaxID=1672016 RepID=A0AAD3YD10_9TREE|nr:hypothetical protein CspeluHIS016_0403060 [Cutaneotrichosporon spelunceum]